MNCLSILSSKPKFLSIVAVSLVIAAHYVRRRRQRAQGVYLDELTIGPKPSSWAAGALTDLIGADNVGDLDNTYAEKYGLTFKIKGIFGSNMLFVADPAAMHYILDTRAYTFHKGDVAKFFRLFLGNGILSSEGQDHARQRRILLPGFSQSVLKDLVPIVSETTDKLISKWENICQNDSNFHVIDVHSWLSKATLDVIGQAIFSYNLGVLEETPSEFAEAYKNLFVGMMRKRSNLERTISDLLPTLPFWIMQLFQRFAFRITDRLSHFQSTARGITQDLIERELKAANGSMPEGKAIMSILVRANLSEEPRRKMSNEELQSQTMVLAIAGHDTTSSTLSWALYELGRNPTIQTKLRNEIFALKSRLGERRLTASDLDTLPYMSAVIKETLRCYPIAPHIIRRASRDETIPLSRPISLGNGRLSDTVSVKKGQAIVLSTWIYNRIKELWGEDADQWNPERFLENNLDKAKGPSLGVYANLATFGSGVYSCIGWRFALLELHTVLFELVQKFEFGLLPQGTEVLRVSTPTLLPLIKGQEDLGAQLPMAVRLL